LAKSDIDSARNRKKEAQRPPLNHSHNSSTLITTKWHRRRFETSKPLYKGLTHKIIGAVDKYNISEFLRNFELSGLYEREAALNLDSYAIRAGVGLRSVRGPMRPMEKLIHFVH